MEKRSNKFSIFYTGERFDQHEMDAETLGDALSGLSKAIFEANKTLNGEQSPPPTIKVKDELRKGSFGIDIVFTDYEQLKNVLEYLGLIAAGTSVFVGSVIGLIKGIRGRPFTIDIVQQEDGSHTAQLHMKDGEVIECDEELAKLVGTPSVQQGLSDLIFAPLEQEGADTFEVYESVESDEAVVVIEREDAPAFKYRRKLIEDFKLTDTYKAEAEFTYAGKYKGTSWKAKLDGVEHSVNITDTEFLEAVQAGDVNAFQNRLFKVDVTKTTKKRFNKAETVRYEITKVYY